VFAARIACRAGCGVLWCDRGVWAAPLAAACEPCPAGVCGLDDCSGPLRGRNRGEVAW